METPQSTGEAQALYVFAQAQLLEVHNAMATMTAMSMVYSLTQRDLTLTQNENMLHVLGANRLMLRPL